MYKTAPRNYYFAITNLTPVRVKRGGGNVQSMFLSWSIIDIDLISGLSPRINLLTMAKSFTEPELKQYNTNGLLDTKS